MANISSFNPDLGIVYIRALPGEDLTGWDLTYYQQKGNTGIPSFSQPVDTSDVYVATPDDGYVYYKQDLGPFGFNSGQRDALVLSDENDALADAVGWGKDEDFPLVGGPGDGVVVDPGAGTHAPGNGPWYLDAPPWASGGPPNLGPVPPPCFVAGTVIETDAGGVLVEELQAGQRVMTLDGPRDIRWIGAFSLRFTDGRRDHLRPIRFCAGSLEPGVPARDTWVSPQHRIYLERTDNELLFGVPSVLVAAKHLVSRPGIFVDTDIEEVTYYHILLEGHHVLTANGMQAESLLVTDPFLSASALAAHHELQQIIAESQVPADAARHRILKTHEAALLRQR